VVTPLAEVTEEHGRLVVWKPAKGTRELAVGDTEGPVDGAVNVGQVTRRAVDGVGDHHLTTFALQEEGTEVSDFLDAQDLAAGSRLQGGLARGTLCVNIVTGLKPPNPRYIASSTQPSISQLISVLGDLQVGTGDDAVV
jgi:hypothetical protein